MADIDELQGALEDAEDEIEELKERIKELEGIERTQEETLDEIRRGINDIIGELARLL